MEEKYPILMSIPKSGTHLMLKLINCLTDKEFVWHFGLYVPFTTKEKFTPGETLLFEEKIDDIGNSSIIVTHSSMARPLQSYLNKNPERKVILLIRDLRDSLVSLLFHESPIHTMHGKRYYEIISNKTDMDNTLKELMLGENLPRGVFNFRDQCYKMVEFIENNKNNSNVLIIKFEDLKTFREGKIGSWNKYFSVEHINLFNNIFAEMHRKLGYEFSLDE